MCYKLLVVATTMSLMSCGYAATIRQPPSEQPSILGGYNQQPPPGEKLVWCRERGFEQPVTVFMCENLYMPTPEQRRISEERKRIEDLPAQACFDYLKNRFNGVDRYGSTEAITKSNTSNILGKQWFNHHTTVFVSVNIERYKISVYGYCVLDDSNQVIGFESELQP
jgi:hypothetical protein